MQSKHILLFLLTFISLGIKSQSISPEALLEKSIKYHDPKEQWGTTPLNLHLKETRPNGADRSTNISIDLQNSTFTLDQMRDGNQVAYKVINDVCSFQLNGSSDISEEDLKKYRLNCERAQSMRNYYTYLWGLPMKLRDEGTILQDAKLTSFMEQEAYSLKVTYSPEVGVDIWYFYFDPTTYAMIGYRFYHDEAANDGEYIPLKGEEKIQGFRLPKERTWYTHKEDKLLGADILEKK